MRVFETSSSPFLSLPRMTNRGFTTASRPLGSTSRTPSCPSTEPVSMMNVSNSAFVSVSLYSVGGREGVSK